MLIDINHNAALIKTQSVAFKGKNGDIEAKELEKRIGVAMGYAGTNDIVLVGKDYKTAQKELEESIDSYPKALSRILFIKDNQATSSFFIGSNHHNIPYVQNLSESPIYQVVENKDYELQKDSTMIPRENGKFKFSKTGAEFKIESNIEATFSDFKNANIETIEVGKSSIAQISELNKRHIKEIDEEKKETKKPKVKKGVTFQDVGGQDKAISELKKSVIYPLKYPKAFKVMNHGIILEGGPGTGKSLMAEALANEVDANYIKLNGLELESKYVGESEAKWRQLFAKAREKQPTIVFLDEFDAVAKKREGTDMSRNDDKTVNQILTLMSDIEKSQDNVFIIAATNRADILDDAITRSGRFGKQINVPNPNLEGCKKIFDIHTKNKQLDENFDKDSFVEKLHSMNVSGADIAAISEDAVNEAYIRAEIFEKMENESFEMRDIEELRITEDDFNAALENFKDSKKDKSKKNPIGFVFTPQE